MLAIANYTYSRGNNKYKTIFRSEELFSYIKASLYKKMK